jgi:acid stress-induced BolA-like protein IbaG/YrbA
MNPAEIVALIEQNLSGARARVATDGQGHYEAVVVCPLFEGKGSVQRHQLVYGALGARVGREIHALALKTLTPAERDAVDDAAR